MPVYLRKNLTITPPSISELQEDDFNDFLQDPDQLRDVLPQPYRMLDKILSHLYDNAWNIIASREKERIAEASRIRPPQYQASIHIQEHGSSNCLCDTEDGQYIIAGLPNGLAVIDALSQNVVDTWIQDDMSITKLQVRVLKEEQYLICTCDEEGVARLFCVAGGKIYMLQAVNEAHSGGPKVMATKCEASDDGTFIGIYFENATTREGHLELYKSPLETWLKELDGAVAKAASKAQASSPQPQHHTETEVPASPSAGEVAEGDPDKSSETQRKSRLGSRASSRAKRKVRAVGTLVAAGLIESSKTREKSPTISSKRNSLHMVGPQDHNQMLKGKDPRESNDGSAVSRGTNKRKTSLERNLKRSSSRGKSMTNNAPGFLSNETELGPDISVVSVPESESFNRSQNNENYPRNRSISGSRRNSSIKRQSNIQSPRLDLPESSDGTSLSKSTRNSPSDRASRLSSRQSSGSAKTRSPKSTSRSPSFSRIGARIATVSRLSIKPSKLKTSPIDLSEKVAEPQETGGENRNAKFTPSNLLIRVKPSAPVQPVMVTSPPQLAKDQGDVLGTGIGHLLSSQHLDARQSWFAHQHQQYMKYLPSGELPSFREPNFHFLTPGRLLPQGLENPVLAGSCTSVAVWWRGSNNLMFYSLTKSAKVEDDAASLGKSMKKAKRTVSGDMKDNEDYADDLYRQRSKVSMTPFKPRAMSHRSTRSQASSGLTDFSRHQEPKPDSVWPMAHAIVASTVSPCTSLIALALSNGSVIIWDKNLGMERRVIHLTEDTEVEKVEFLDPSICPQEVGNYPPYGTRTNVYLLATCKDSQMFVLECELGNEAVPSQVTQAFFGVDVKQANDISASEMHQWCFVTNSSCHVLNSIENKDERYVDIKKVAGIPNMVLACRQDGLIYLINLHGGNVICEITLPENYQLATPCKPVTAIGGRGQMVFIKAESKISDNDESNSEAGHQSKLFVFPLRQYNILNRHRIKERPVIPYTIHSTAQNRVDALLAERLSQQSMRKDRMQARWGQMKGELELMIQIRKEAATRVSNREAYLESSIEKTIIREEVETPHPMLMN